MNIVVSVALVIACVLIGREAGKWLFGAKKNLTHTRRSALALAVSLREMGMKRVPEVIEELAVGEVSDLLEALRDMSKLMKAGNETILKELEGTFERVLDVKLSTPEGRAVVKARLIEVEAIVAKAAIVAAPFAKAAVVAALI